MVRIIGFLLLLSCFQAKAQQGAAITYELMVANESTPRLTLLLTVNDSVSFETTTSVWGKKSSYKKPLGSGFKSHDTYTNRLKNLLLTQSNPYNSKRYLVEDSLQHLQWKEEEGEREILGYACKKAIAFQNGQPLVAWYAPSLPYYFGPRGTGGLPGLILELTDATHQSVFRAVTVSPSTEKIVEPVKGKRVSAAEFQTILKELRN